MSHEFRLADIGEGLEEAEIVRWLVAVGDEVRRDQPIVEVMTDKSNAELPAPVAGVVRQLGGAVGDLIEVGEVVAVIDDGAAVGDLPSAGTFRAATAPMSRETPASPESPADEQPSSVEPGAVEIPSPTDEQPPGSNQPAMRPKASPSTRAEAARRGIDLSAVSGTGPGGRILLSDLGPMPTAGEAASDATTAPASGDITTALDGDDVVVVPEDPAPIEPTASTIHQPGITQDPAPPSPDQAVRPKLPPPQTTAAPSPASEAAAPAPASLAPDAASSSTMFTAGVEPLRGIRRAIANNMHRSWSEIPHIHALQHIDAEPLLELRQQLRTSGRESFDGLTPLTFFVAAVAAAMRAHPQANATLDLEAGTITTHPAVHVGIAVAAPQGLVVPVIRDADQQPLAELADEVRRLVGAARAGDLEADDFRGGTVTITNFGSLGGEQALPLIRPPESVIFGFGSIDARPFVIDGEVVARRTMHLVLGADHRLLDGDVTTSMLTMVADSLTSPINLVLG